MVQSLQHLALSVPDLKVGADFYTTFGMNMCEGDDTLAFRCDNRDHDEIVLLESGKSRKFHHISFATTSEDLQTISKKLQAQDIAQLDPPYKDADDGIWFRDLEGNLVNIHVAPTKAIAAEAQPAINRPGTVNRRNAHGCPPFDMNPRPRRLGHMILFTPNVPAQTKFYTEVLGMQLSARIVGDYAAFLRCAGDSDHHVLGLLHSTAPGFHHASFEMGSIDETEVAAKRILDKGYKHVWGPGRHGVGSNYFHYFRDPWHGMTEYFFDIDYIAGDYDWEVDEFTKQNGMFLWAADGPPPSDFGTNYEAE